MGRDALLEIYSEELPVSFILPAIKQLEKMAGEVFAEQNILHGKLCTYATPRRLSLYIEDIAEETEQIKEEIIGPPLRVAYTEDNQPTKAALGFARNNGVGVKELVIKETPKGKYISVVRITPGSKTEKILPTLFTKIIGNLYFPKTMVWEEGRFRYARPIRSVMALYGNKPLKFKIAGVSSVNFTYGLYVTSSKRLKISSPEKYLTILRNNYVIADHVVRQDILRKTISEISKKLAKETNSDCKIVFTDELLNEINFLVEHPSAIICRFPRKFLSLPKEILITCMEKKHKFLAVVDKNDKMTDYFIGIRNGISEGQAVVREGYEKVVAATLEDALFFYNQDIKTPLESKLSKLKELIFHEKIGTIFDKVGRLDKLSGCIQEFIPARQNTDVSAVGRCVALCKNDLVTCIVYEHPELQGVAGRIYAAHDGEPYEVLTGIEEHYFPLFADGKLPSTRTGLIVSLADKIDTIVSDFAIGLVPTGSADPYGLRRQAIGVLRIIHENKLNVSLKKLVGKSMEILPSNLGGNNALGNSVIEFFRQRFEIILENEGYKFDEIRAVLSSGTGLDDVNDIYGRIRALKEIRLLSEFNSLNIGYKRAANIVKQAEQKGMKTEEFALQADRFIENQEKDLHNEYLKVKSKAEELIGLRKYNDFLQELITLRPYIDSFFDKVMVMADDESIKNNRLALLRKIVNLFTEFGDLSLLQ